MVYFDTLLTAAPGTYGLTAPDAVTVAAATAIWTAAYALAVNPATRTAGTVAAKDNARASAESVVRPFAVNISLNAAVAPAAKTDIGVTVRSTTPTPIPAPTDAPVNGLTSQIPTVATMTYKEDGAVGKSKPFGVVGVEVFAAVGDTFTSDPTDASYRETVTKSPYTLTFTQAERGKAASVFTRWITRSGPSGKAQVGPFSTAEDFFTS